jgi:DUF4097 and DUF4098 domain-containing protein YvlB
MTIHLPSTIFKEVNIRTNSGNVIVSSLITNKLNLEVGAGKTDIDNLIVYKEARISTGVGKVNIDGVLINNLRLSNGVGETHIRSNFSGESEIKSGVGNISIEALMPMDNYTFVVKKGVGDIVIDGHLMDSGQVGSAPNVVFVESGIGTIDIKCREQN